MNTLPAFAPPTWTVLVFFLAAYKLNLWLVVVCGVIGATLGRLILSHYIKWFSHQLFNQKQNENLEYLGERIGNTPISNFIFVFLYSLTPLSTTALFVAAGVAKIRLNLVLTGFFLGRLISYTVLALSTQVIAVNISDLQSGIISAKNVCSALLALLTICAFIFVDWRELLEHKKIAFNFAIWKWNK